MRVEDLQAQVNRLARESKKSSEKMEGALSRLQETERSMERVAKARESSELWREVRELRSQLSDVRLQSLVRSPRRDLRAVKSLSAWDGWSHEATIESCQ
eukprot:symbB.v1.2.017636.t1/scaffold1373.1/size231899/1